MNQRASRERLFAAARAMPHVRVEREDTPYPVFRVGSKSFVFSRMPKRDAADPETGEPWDDVVMLKVASEIDKAALLEDPNLPFFTVPHFDGHASVLVRTSRLGEVDVDLLTEIVQEGWLAAASRRRANAWLAEHDLPLLP